MSSEITYSAFESRYKDRQYIGSGGFAKVYKVFDYVKNHYVALKIADVKPEWNKFTLRNEVEIVNKLSPHRNIARYDACYRFDTGRLTGEMDFAILRFYEYGNLEQLLKKQELSSEDKRHIIQGVLDGVAFLHKNKVIHRDLKAQNILMHREDGIWTPKITDFGLSREVLESGDITNSAIGLSYAYAAPEQIQNSKIYKNVDLWATGVIIYRIMANELPFQGRSGGDNRSTQSQLELSRKIVNLELPDKLNSIEEPYQRMIRHCLVLDPLKRAQTAEELIAILQGTSNFDSQLVAEPLSDPPPPSSPEDPETNKTEIYNPQTEDTPMPDSMPKQDPPKPLAEEKTEIIQPGVDQIPEQSPPGYTATPPGFSPATKEEYATPRLNVTQFIDKKVAATSIEEEVPPVKVFRPNTGDPVKRFNWRWILVPLILMVVGAAGFYLYLLNEKAQIVEKEPPAPAVISRYEPIDEKIEEYKDRKTSLLGLSEEVNALITPPENTGNYRPQYLSAKIAAYTEKNPRSAFNSLINAAKIAIVNSDADRMLWDLKKDETGAFTDLKKFEKNWNSIIKSLEEAR